MGSKEAGLAAGLLALIVTLPYKAVAVPAAPTSTSLVVASGANSLSSGATIPSGTVVTFVVSVSSGATKLTTGQVKLCDAAAAHCTDIHQFGMAQLTSAGRARFRFVPGIGSHSYKAVFAGTPGGTTAYAGSSSPSVILTVTGSHTSSTAIARSGFVGNYTLRASVHGIANVPGLAAPTGTVSFLDTTNANAVLGTSAVGSATSGLTFFEGNNPQLTIDPYAIATADFNGDGFPDLVVGEYNTSNVLLNVLLGKGDGSFTPVATPPTAGHYTAGFAVGDYNGDGIPDLAVSSLADYAVNILLGKGDGTFSAAPNLEITAQSVVTGDFNGDGIADIATAEGYAVSVFLGKGDGTFITGAKNSWPQVNPLWLATGDFNGDGLTDIAVTDTAVKGSVFVLLSKGDGTFLKTTLTPTTGFELGGIAAADLNGDGFLDLVTANALDDASQGLTVLLGKGDGTFRAPELLTVPLSLGQRSVVVADFNGDGIPDLATAASVNGPIDVLPGKGDGTFDIAVNVPFSSQYTTGYLAAADFDGDGIPDLAQPDAGQVLVLLAEPEAAVTATLSGIAIAGTGTHQVVASYPGDSFYQPSVSSATGLTAMLTPTVTVKPSLASITMTQALPVNIVVSGVKGYPTPTGTVQLNSASYVSAAIALSNGSLTITIPAGTLAAGANTLEVVYLPDDASSAIYSSQSGSASVVVESGTSATIPTFTPGAGTYPSAQRVSITDATPESMVYYTVDGSDPTIASSIYTGPIWITSTETIKALATAPGFAPSAVATASFTIGIPNSGPVLSSLSPAFTSMGGQGFTLTVNGAGFTAGSVVSWGATPLATQFVSGNQLVAQVPASDVVTAGTSAITVQTPVPGEAQSNALQFEIDSATTGSAAAPVFSAGTATITAGSTASYPVVLPSTATNISASCLNLPSGATCSYSATSQAVTISSLSSTPAGTYQVTVVFTETERGAATAIVLLPILLLPFIGPGKKISSRPFWLMSFLGILLLVMGASITACGGNSGSTQTPPPNVSHQVTNSGTVNLIIQ